MKRILIILCALTLVFCGFFGVLSVSAEESEIPDGYTVLDYLDYVTGYSFGDVWRGFAYFSFGEGFFTSVVNDVNGTRVSTDGNREWSIVLDNDSSWSADSTAQFPGGYDNLVFLDLSNIPNGSILQVQALADVLGLDSQQTELKMTINSGITYFDENFVKITDHYSEQQEFVTDTDQRISQLVNMTVQKPENAMYCTMYSRVNFGVERSSEMTSTISIRFQWDEPTLMVSTTYTQMIVEAIIKAKLPNGNGQIVSAEDLEEVLKDATSSGFEDAKDIINEAPNSLYEHIGAFMFFTYIFDLLITVGWIRSILMIGLSFGILSFVLNILHSASNVTGASGKSKGGGGKK